MNSYGDTYFTLQLQCTNQYRFEIGQAKNSHQLEVNTTKKQAVIATKNTLQICHQICNLCPCLIGNKKFGKAVTKAVDAPQKSPEERQHETLVRQITEIPEQYAVKMKELQDQLSNSMQQIKCFKDDNASNRKDFE